MKMNGKLTLSQIDNQMTLNTFMDGKILVPQNLWFVGTANKDDSTFTITDKVYDRAASIVMNESRVCRCTLY